ncbi:MAG: ABC transporter substrate-binding protein [Eubacterium sp.]|nr:ABC transporter substrate-binding protein [Eubacterium sp.]
MKLRKVVASLLVAAMTVSLAACGGSASSTESSDASTDANEVTEVAAEESEPVYGGSVSVFDDDFSVDACFEPAAQTSPWRLCYEALWAVDWTLDRNEYSDMFRSGYVTMDEATGQIADSWEFDSDSAVLTVKLRDDVYFQDLEPYNGRQLTAEDVKWSYDRTIGLDGAEVATGDIRTDWATAMKMLTKVEVIDDFTVAFTLTSGDEITLNNFIVNSMSLMIAGSEWDSLTDEQKTDYHYLVGTGPYIISEYEADNYIKWVRNENYYDTDDNYPENQLPYLDEVTILNFESTSNQVSQFIAGNLDFLYRTQSNISASELEMITTSDVDYSVYSYSTSPIGVAFKQTDLNEPLKDVRVREALQYAIDGQEIWSEYHQNEGDIQICGVFNSLTNLSAVDDWSEEAYLAYTTQDLDKAKALLEEAGYPDGFEFSVAIFPNLDSDLFYLAADYLSEIGVTMKVNIYNTPVEMEAAGYDVNTQDCLFCTLGSMDLEMTAQFVGKDGARNSFFYSDDTMEGYLQGALNATNIEDQESNAQALDKYVAENFLQLMIGGSAVESWYANDRVHGYSGENFDIKKNFEEQTLAHVWVEE